MRATVMHQARDVRIENVPDAAIWEPNGAGAPQTAHARWDAWSASPGLPAV
jgi:hypothetical protein